MRSLLPILLALVLAGCANTTVVQGYERINSFLGSALVPETSSFDTKTKKAAVAGIIMAEESISGAKFGVTQIDYVKDGHEKWTVKREDDSIVTYDVFTDGVSIKVAWPVPGNSRFRNEVEFKI